MRELDNEKHLDMSCTVITKMLRVELTTDWFSVNSYYLTDSNKVILNYMDKLSIAYLSIFKNPYNTTYISKL